MSSCLLELHLIWPTWKTCIKRKFSYSDIRGNYKLNLKQIFARDEDTLASQIPKMTIFMSSSDIWTQEWDHGRSQHAAKSLQSCPTLCDPIDGSPLGSYVPGILQARILEWVAISFSNAWKWKVKVKSLSRPRLLATPRTAAYQASPSMGFSRQEYWSGVPLPSPKPAYTDLKGWKPQI